MRVKTDAAELPSLTIDRGSAVPISVQLLDQLTWLMATRALAPGGRLPSIRELAASLGIHHHTVRAVYRELEADGLVAIRHGAGATVQAFAPLHLARARANSATAMIGVLIAGFNPFYLPFLRGVERAAAQARTLSVVAVTEDSPVKARLQIDQLVAAGVGGIIAASIGQLVPLLPAQASTDEARQIVPIVYCDQPDQTRDSFVFDAPAAGYEMATHLASHRRRRVTLLTPSLEPPNIAALHEGFRRAVAESVISGVNVVLTDGFSIDAGAGAARKALTRKRRPSAIATVADELALGVLSTAREMAIPVPSELAIVSYGEIEASRYVDPPLTTVALPAEEMGFLATRRLAERIRGEPPGATTHLEARLAIRGSCGSH